jgi:hypothetical protein
MNERKKLQKGTLLRKGGKLQQGNNSKTVWTPQWP